MLTECPHCLSVLRVSADQIYADDARVRCGECLRVFNAYENQTQTVGDLDSTDLYEPCDSTVSDVDELDVPNSPSNGFHKPNNDVDELRAMLNATEAIRRAAPATPPVETLPSPSPEISEPTAAKVEPSAKPDQAVQHPVMPPPISSAGDSTEDSATSNVAPDSIEPASNQRTSVLSQSPIKKAALSISAPALLTGILLLALTAMAINTLHGLANDPYLREEISRRWCAVIECNTQVTQDYSQLDILRRNIYAHPNQNGVLVISVSVINRAARAVEYPTLQVRMTDKNGTAIATGDFTPVNYMENYADGLLVKPEQTVDIVVQVADPGAEAQSFDLQFY